MKKMTMKQWENTKTDKKLDKAEAKKGIKENSKKDNAIDRVAKAKGYKAAAKKLNKK